MAVSEERIPIFFSLLARGFLIRVHPGCSVREMICMEMGIPEEYFKEKVKTLFLDGRVVDDSKRTLLRDGSVLALSAAMPGAAGMMLRRDTRQEPGGCRDSGEKGTKPSPDHAFTVLVKLFNLVQRDLGPGLLRKGVLISGQNFLDFFHRHRDAFRGACMHAGMGGEEINPGMFQEMIGRERNVLLQLETGPGIDPE